jgi:hypothetical protein
MFFFSMADGSCLMAEKSGWLFAIPRGVAFQLNQ